MDFDEYQAVLLDLDGTIYHEEQALPGAGADPAPPGGGTRVRLSHQQHQKPPAGGGTLRRMGVEVGPEHVYTAAAAAVDYVMQRFGAELAPPADFQSLQRGRFTRCSRGKSTGSRPRATPAMPSSAACRSTSLRPTNGSVRRCSCSAQGRRWSPSVPIASIPARAAWNSAWGHWRQCSAMPPGRAPSSAASPSRSSSTSFAGGWA